MVHSESPTAGALEEVRRLAGSSAAIQSVMRLEGGQHADTWRVDTASPEMTVVVRQFPAGDSAGAREQQVLHALDGLGELVPVLTGIVDWSSAARGPRGYDVGWCRLDLVLLFDERIADVFLAAYEDRNGCAIDDIALWDRWALARSHDTVESWVPNYAPLGRADLTAQELRRRHSRWTARRMERT